MRDGGRGSPRRRPGPWPAPRPGGAGPAAHTPAPRRRRRAGTGLRLRGRRRWRARSGPRRGAAGSCRWPAIRPARTRRPGPGRAARRLPGRREYRRLVSIWPMWASSLPATAGAPRRRSRSRMLSVSPCRTRTTVASMRPAAVICRSSSASWPEVATVLRGGGAVICRGVSRAGRGRGRACPGRRRCARRP